MPPNCICTVVVPPACGRAGVHWVSAAPPSAPLLPASNPPLPPVAVMPPLPLMPPVTVVPPELVSPPAAWEPPEPPTASSAGIEQPAAANTAETARQESVAFVMVVRGGAFFLLFVTRSSSVLERMGPFLLGLRSQRQLQNLP